MRRKAEKENSGNCTVFLGYYHPKKENKTKNDSQPVFWRFWLPKHLRERNV